MQLNKSDYILSFWVQGISVFVTDIHVDVYKELEVLFLIDNGMFKQYFTNAAYQKALDRGLEFYSDKDAFSVYKKALTKHTEIFKKFFESAIKGKRKLSKSTVQTFFDYTTKLCKDYTYMNFEFTDKAYSEKEKNPTIDKNLLMVSKFKDFVRSFMNQVLFEPKGYVNELFTILGKQFNIDSDILHNLTQQEILDLYDNKKPYSNSVSERQNLFAINFDRSLMFQGQDATEIIEIFRDVVGNKNVVKGRPASLGKAKGRVKIIKVDYADLKLLNVEIAKMNKGDILIAETTAPELVLACQKASAIVTDVGGMLSHAAIVSREFGIPCIVGTENATKIFKDGDVVEVDAGKGTVIKIT